MDQKSTYRRFLILIAGLGGLLYGIDVGIIAAALVYLGKTIDLTVGQTSILVAAVLGGSMVSSPIAGLLSDQFGRKRMMIASGLMFVASVGLIVLSQGFASLLFGRLLQGMSGGVIAVVVPLYLAECLGAETRGRGTAIFQFMLTFGIVVAAVVGWYYTRQAEFAVAHAAGNLELIRSAQNHAWRNMFLAVVYPGIAFFAGAFLLAESPRWLMRQGKKDQALKALLRSHDAASAQRELQEMQGSSSASATNVVATTADRLLQRKYVIPFVLACVILTANQATGINSILGFLVLILKQAGLTTTRATQGDVVVKVINCVMTLVAVSLVDRRGRRFLLRLGTGSLVLALVLGGFSFRVIEARSLDVKAKLDSLRSGDTLQLPIDALSSAQYAANQPTTLTVLYSYGHGNHIASVRSDDIDRVLSLHPDGNEAGQPLTIKRARYGPPPGPAAGLAIMVSMALFIASYAVGPGVVVWLMLSELMPTRIRSVGMGVALLLNQGASTLIASVFLPVVGRFGYSAIFFVWAGCTLLYFLTASLFVPETKGRTLEEIEQFFAGTRKSLSAG